MAYDYRVTANNDSAWTAGGTVTFTTAPAAVADEALVERGVAERVDVLSNDVGSGIDPSTITVEAGPEHGRASVDPEDGNITYTHDGSASRRDTLTYTVGSETGQRADPAALAIGIADLQVQADEARRGSPVAVSVEAIGPFAPSTAAIYARKGGETRYTSVANTDVASPSADTVSVSGTIRRERVTARGVDYYAQFATADDTLTVPAGDGDAARTRPAHLAVTFDELAPDTSQSAMAFREEVYRMVSVPGRPNGVIKAALRETYGSYDATQWRLLRWSAAANSGEGGHREYPAIDTLAPGQGFWLVTRQGIPPSVSGGQTVAADSAYRIPLRAGAGDSTGGYDCRRRKDRRGR